VRNVKTPPPSEQGSGPSDCVVDKHRISSHSGRPKLSGFLNDYWHLIIALVFICLNPYFNFIAQNIEQINISDANQILFLLLALLLFSIFTQFFVYLVAPRLISFSLVLTAVILYISLDFEYFFVSAISISYLTGLVLKAEWILLLSIVFIASILYFIVRYRLSIVFLLVFLISSTLLSAVEIFSFALKAHDSSVQISSQDLPRSPLGLNGSDSIERNAYLIISDGHASSKVLLDEYSYDSSEFENTLKAANFRLLNSHANYLMTYLAVQALFAVNYPVKEGVGLYSDRRSFYPSSLRAKEPPQLISYLKAIDYDVWLSANAWSGCSEIYLNCINSTAYNQFFASETNVFLQKTVFLRLLEKLGVFSRTNREKYDAITPFLEELPRILKSSGKPKFFIVHHFPPHPPHFFNERCEEQSSMSSGWAAPEDYIKSIRCVNSMLKEVIEEIEKSDPDAIVVIQSDHGPSINLEWKKPVSDWRDEDIAVRAGILNAVKAPEECGEYLKNNLGPVNTMRFVLACLTKTQPEYLDDLTILTTYEKNPDYGSAFIWDPATVKR